MTVGRMNRIIMPKRNRCIVYSFLFSSSLVAIILCQLNYVSYKHFFRAKSKTLRESLFLEGDVDQVLLLLHPEQDESNILSSSEYFRSSQTKNRLYIKTRTRKQSVKHLTQWKDKSSVMETSDVQTLVEYKTHDMQIEQSTDKKVSGNLMGSIEEHYFEAIMPKLESTTQGRVQVLIVTNRRSGSSFLGQFFNQNPDTFFQFEPLKLTEWKKEFYPDVTDYLHHLIKCEFDKTPYLLEFFNKESLHRASSRLLVEPPLCNASFKSVMVPSMVKRRCEPLQLLPMTQACQKKQYYTAKLIRLYGISSLESLAYDPEINLKIIHLVRDPRGTYTSRSRLKSTNISLELGPSLDNGISYLCRRINRNLEFIRSQPAWIQGKYKLVRYEDIANNPEELAQEIYDFTGMGPLPNKVQQWIHNNTKSMVKSSGKSPNTYYSTARDASKVSEAWRYHVPFKVALRMQDFCRETLRELGYVEVKTEEELLDKNKSLVTRKLI